MKGFQQDGGDFDGLSVTSCQKQGAAEAAAAVRAFRTDPHEQAVRCVRGSGWRFPFPPSLRCAIFSSG